MGVTLSCAFAPSPDTPAHVAAAESLGYARAWLYDSPALYPDVWATLALAAVRTSRIGLGPGVLVPSLRHPMVNASATAQLAALAPGRVAVAVGAGFTGRATLGKRPMRWTDVRAYVAALRGLLRGDTVDWDGAALQMMHPHGFAPARPVEVPVLIGADGPKGLAVARDLGDGVMATSPQAGWPWCTVLTFGTVLGDDEDPGSPRVLDAAGHAGSVALHALYERRRDGLDRLPGGRAWADALEAEVEPRLRHLALHDGHLVRIGSRDRHVVDGTLLAAVGAARTVDGWVQRLRHLRTGGATEIAYQPAGADITGELARFAHVFQASGIGQDDG